MIRLLPKLSINRPYRLGHLGDSICEVQHRSRFLLFESVIALVASVGLALTEAAAQDQATVSQPPQLLTETAVEIESLGVSLRLPAGSIVVREEASVDPRVHIEDSQKPPRFRLQMQIASSDPTLRSAAAVAMDHLKKAKERQRGLEVVANEVFEGANCFGHLIFTSVALDAQTTAVTGWLIVPLEDSWFLVISILTSGLDYQQARVVLDPSFASLKIADFTESYNLRGARLKNGVSIIAAIKRDFAMICRDHEPIMYRIYTSAAAGVEKEVGWLLETSRDAARGAADPSIKLPYTGADATSGQLLVLQAQTIDQSDSAATIDTDGRFWSAFDRSQELWLARVAERQGQSLKMFNQMGLRSAPSVGQPIPELQVFNQASTGQPNQDGRWTVPSELYLSQFEFRSLGQLLPRDGSFEGGASIYAFDSASGKLLLHIIDWTKSGENEWTLGVRKGMDKPREVCTYDTSGQLIRRLGTDGTITERIAPEKLREIWRSKGLPL